jgi:hypothetical protein
MSFRKEIELFPFTLLTSLQWYRYEYTVKVPTIGNETTIGDEYLSRRKTTTIRENTEVTDSATWEELEVLYSTSLPSHPL